MIIRFRRIMVNRKTGTMRSSRRTDRFPKATGYRVTKVSEFPVLIGTWNPCHPRCQGVKSAWPPVGLGLREATRLFPIGNKKPMPCKDIGTNWTCHWRRLDSKSPVISLSCKAQGLSVTGCLPHQGDPVTSTGLGPTSTRSLGCSSDEGSISLGQPLAMRPRRPIDQGVSLADLPIRHCAQATRRSCQCGFKSDLIPTVQAVLANWSIGLRAARSLGARSAKAPGRNGTKGSRSLGIHSLNLT